MCSQPSYKASKLFLMYYYHHCCCLFVCTHVCVCVGMYMHVYMLLGTHVQAGMPMMVSSPTFISAIQRLNSGCQAHKRELLPAESLHEYSSPYS